MTYTDPQRRDMIQEVAYNAASQVLAINAEVEGVSVTPTSQSAVIYHNGGDQSIVSVVVSTASNRITVTFSTTDLSNFVPQQIYRCVVTFGYGGKTYNREIIFIVARVVTEDACPIRLDDLKGMHERIDACLTNTRQSTDAVGRYITTAWEEVRETLMAQGVKVHTVNPISYKTAVRYSAAMNLAIGMLKASGDAWTVVLAEWTKRFDRSMAHMVLLARQADTFSVNAERGRSQPLLTIGPDHDMDIAGQQPFGGLVYGAGPYKGVR